MNGGLEWTEIGDQRGLDHLGMLAPVESCYQSLLQGLSSVTTRIRYYAFHCWWLADYSRKDPSSSRSAYSLRTRRAEALFALASSFSGSAATGLNGEQGLSGRRWAEKMLLSGSNTINFRSATDPATPESERYLGTAQGDFMGIYAPQMTVMELLHRNDVMELPVPSKLGFDLAERFAASVGTAGGIFLSAVQEGVIDRSALAELSKFRPGALDHGSDEAEALRDLLFARSVSISRHETRRKTLHAILETARQLDAPVSEDVLRWHWMERAQDPSDPRHDILERWRHYQSGDTLRLVYEALFALVLREMSNEGQPVPLANLVGQIAAVLGGRGSFGQVLAAIDRVNGERTMKDLQQAAIGRQLATLPLDEALTTILGPLARLMRIWSGKVEDLGQSYPPRHRAQTVRDELLRFENASHDPVERVLETVLREQILKRHLVVAGQKFRQQQSYTYCFEVDEARLRYRSMVGLAPSGPRLRSAIRFLEDVGCLDQGKISPLGLRELAAA